MDLLNCCRAGFGVRAITGSGAWVDFIVKHATFQDCFVSYSGVGYVEMNLFGGATEVFVTGVLDLGTRRGQLMPSCHR